jgi:hypothetical protein
MLPTDCVRTSSAPCTTTAPQENEYEIHNRHPFAHDIDCHNRCGCAGWNRAWSSEVANHRHATADTCADDCFTGRASVEAFPAQVTISFNDEIAPTGVGKGYAAFRSVSEAHISRGRDESDRSWLETRPLIQMQRHPYSGRPPQWFLHTPLQEVIRGCEPLLPPGKGGAIEAPFAPFALRRMTRKTQRKPLHFRRVELWQVCAQAATPCPSAR